jgi:hypothetical protein
MPAGTDHLDPNEALSPGQSLMSFNQRYELAYQGDGNLVVYRHGGGGSIPLWASNTYGRPSSTCAMQGDGNLVMYDDGGAPVWSSGTWGNDGSRCFMQDDGNAVIYNSGSQPIWASNTAQATTGPFRGSCALALNSVGGGGVTARLDFGANGGVVVFEAPIVGLGLGALAGGVEVYQSTDELVAMGDVNIEIQLWPVYFQAGWKKLDGGIIGSVQGAGLSLVGYATGTGRFRFA